MVINTKCIRRPGKVSGLLCQEILKKEKACGHVFWAAACLCVGHPVLRATGVLEVTWMGGHSRCHRCSSLHKKCVLVDLLGGKTLRVNQDVTGGPVKKCGNEKISLRVKN